jgi:flavin reductase (DIM6/NTAB) family NADH-FMN oxidoreductase RutF
VQLDGNETIQSAFRDVMRQYATSVSVVTTVDEQGNRHGMAASSVISVSMEPPSILFAVNKAASLHGILERASHFVVNVLGSEQLDIVECFSRSELREQRFKVGNWGTGAFGLPFVTNGCAAIFCRLDRIIAYGTHSLHIGVVEQVIDGSAEAPLIWLDGSRAELLLRAG